jgi:hypothetical protein
MKNIIGLILIVSLSLSSVFAQESNEEKDLIKKIIQTAYVDGLQNKGEVEDIIEGFHSGFNLLGVNHNMLTKYPIYNWVQSFEERKAKDSTPPKAEDRVTCNYLLIDVTGNAAMAKIELVRNEMIIFTDYLQLYKFEEGWKIVSKIYYRH